jgi:homoserine dehydrogenase
VDTGDAEADAFDIILLGWGNIARELAELVSRRNPEIERRFGVRGRVVLISDRSGFLLRPSGIPLMELKDAVTQKAAGNSVSSLPGSLRGSLSDAVDAARSYRLVRPVLVDLTDGSGSEALFEKAFDAKWDVVTANKKPLASAPEAYDALLASAARAGRTLRAEATVGAGLPVVDTLDMLLVTGDSLVRADGCLSGTLAFVLGQVEAGEKFSDAVREAHRRGYTEPDPYADLSGADVARKSIIISRIAEFSVPLERVEVEGLVPPELEGLPLETFFEKLTELDDTVAERARSARAAGKVLRYVGQVLSDRIQVGPLEVPIESPLGRLAGTDNMIVFHSDRYSNTPLVVQGPGAGVDVTAMGVLGDIVRIVAERS